MENEEKKNNGVVDTDAEQDELNQENASLEAGIRAETVDTEIVGQVRDSFLDYAMSVIVSRAIPDVKDGFKPVHRRVVYGMFEAGYTSDKPYVKCAKVVGDVMGKYHPHGDSAIYDTLVRLAQPFSMRYPLVDGHGNFGNMDGDGAAAYRYTECRLNKMAFEMVRDINCNTVPFVPNYDGSLEEPQVLPSRFPNLLVNGSDGIAVGMATKLPSHNLNEVINGIIEYSKNPDITVEELMKFIKAPDFATGGVIYGLGGIRDAYTTGRGTFRIRSRCKIVEEANGKSKIVVTEIPYQVRKADLVAKIGELARDKVIDGITSIKDYSKADVNIEIELRRDVVPSVILNQLFKNTQLEISFGCINLCIVNGEPKVLSLKEMIAYYLDFQIDVIVRRTTFLKAKDEARVNIVEGLLLAHDNIDEVIALAKASKNAQDLIEQLMKRFSLNEEQAKAIAAMTISRLTGLETQKLLDEKASLLANISEYNRILSSKENQLNTVITELQEVGRKFGDERRTTIDNSISSVEDADLIPVDDIVITLTQNGYIKRVSTSEFKTQNRGGIGVKGMTIYNEDEVNKIVYVSTHDDILFFSNLGRIYRKKGFEIPESSRIGKGIPALNLLNLDKEETIVAMISVKDYNDKYLLFVTKNAIVKRTKLDEFIRINCNGKYAITFKEDDNLFDVKVTDGTSKILIASNVGQLCMFEENEVRVMGRTAAGVKGMNLKDGYVVGVATSLEGDKVLVLSELGLGKLSPTEDYRLTHRGSSGVKTIKITAKTGSLVSMRVVNGDEDYLAITNAGTIVRSEISQVRECGRNSIGVKMINLRDKESVTSFTVLPHTVEEPIIDETTKEIEPQETEDAEPTENAGSDEDKE
jgi:DNA gyrase subunit A